MIDIDRISLHAFKRLVKVSESGIVPMPSFDVYTHEDEELPWFKDDVDQLMMRLHHITINSPKTLAWLTRLFRRLGGKTIVRQIAHIDEAHALTSGKQARSIVINCSGHGAATLGGVADPLCFPTRGQIAILKAPNVKYTITREGRDGTFDYVIPRDDGNVVLGGSWEEGATSMTPDPATASRILKNAGGLRLEAEWHSPADTASATFRPAYLVVHAYGIGGGGYQSSWGIACKVLEMVKAQAGASKAGAAAASNSSPKLHGVKDFDTAMRRILAVGNIKSRL
ncbi:hypothetical protein H9P43_002842 [Blastocladiella emersonii ATCC 22665]|nr:hypothetical protein H9P43_002842 [Blastocladiella emersonii ATCC 22665]